MLHICLAQVFGRSSEGESVDHLLAAPEGGGRFGDIEVQNPSSVMEHDNKDVKDSESHGWHCEKVNGRNRVEMISQKCHPLLIASFAGRGFVFLDG